MLKNNKYVLLLGLCVLSILGVTLFNNISKVDALNDNTSKKVVLKKALSPKNLVRTMQRQGVKPQELYFQEGEIQGGYTIKKGQSLKDASKKLLKEHQKFLDVALQNADKQLKLIEKEKKNQKDEVKLKKLNDARVRVKNLKSDFSNSLNDFKAGKFKIKAIEIDNDQEIKKLQKAGMVKDILQSKPVSKKEKKEKLKDIKPVIEKQFEGFSLSSSSNDDAGISLASLSHETWAPYWGYSAVNQNYTYQAMYFGYEAVADFNGFETYEQETQVYDSDFADYAGYWSSNLPGAYYDTQFGDDLDMDNFTVGSLDPNFINTLNEYYTYMSLTPGNSNSAWIMIKGQKGIAYCRSTWCVFATATTDEYVGTYAPSYDYWTY